MSLEVGETVVFRNESLIVTWNHSATFNVYDLQLKNIDVFTCYDIQTIDQAIDQALLHLLEN